MNDERNSIDESAPDLLLSNYFLERWMPELGPKLFLIVIYLRRLCLDQGQSTCSPTVASIAEGLNISPRTVERVLNPTDPKRRELLELFIRKEPQYKTDPATGKRYRTSNLYHVAMKDPIHPDDRELFEQTLARLIEEDAARKAKQ